MVLPQAEAVGAGVGSPGAVDIGVEAYQRIAPLRIGLSASDKVLVNEIEALGRNGGPHHRLTLRIEDLAGQAASNRKGEVPSRRHFLRIEVHALAGAKEVAVRPVGPDGVGVGRGPGAQTVVPGVNSLDPEASIGPRRRGGRLSQTVEDQHLDTGHPLAIRVRADRPFYRGGVGRYSPEREDPASEQGACGDLGEHHG